MSDLSLTTSRMISAPREEVFEAWLAPEMLMKFMNPGENTSVPHAATDPVEGGRFEIMMRAGDKDIPHAGTYTKISRHDRLVFTWESPFSTDGSTVTLDFAEVEGGTEVTLTHVTFPSQESRDNHNAGWTAILGVLAGLLETADA